MDRLSIKPTRVWVKYICMCVNSALNICNAQTHKEPVVDSFKASLLPNAIIMMAKGTTGVVRPRNNYKILVSNPRMRG